MQWIERRDNNERFIYSCISNSNQYACCNSNYCYFKQDWPIDQINKWPTVP